MQCPTNVTNATMCMEQSIIAFCGNNGCISEKFARCDNRCVIYGSQIKLEDALLTYFRAGHKACGLAALRYSHECFLLGGIPWSMECSVYG